MEDQLKLMQEYMGDEIVKGILIPMKLREYFEKNPLHPDDSLDLNPHLHIKHICAIISQQVIDEGVSCTYEDVMHQWLTIAVFHRELLPLFAKP
jgi:hypothetical protein